MYKIKAFITIHGDPSVGIFDSMDEAEINNSQWELYPEEREEVREILKQAWFDIYDCPISVCFDDECNICGHVKTECKCPTEEQCIKDQNEHLKLVEKYTSGHIDEEINKAVDY
ncbi:MAG: hypothetical protein LLF82_000338 [Dehalococcoides mccartyi]|uniref:hypothetical protein n=1 Tax=Dehalococcoides mccartyi TaxID=61435 RepID=UPI00242F8CE7|nr:hypothetical protein [Dehalococcoides mccartyi]MCF7634872.1 hypothetical protein [Dehalococcoides mccartyi]